MRYLPTRRWTTGLLVAFSCCIVAAGHGIAPLGLALVLGVVESPMHAILGWSPLVLLAIARLVGNRWLYATALAGMGTIWGVAWAYSEARGLLALSSAPFLFLLAVQLRDVVLGVEDEDRATT